MANLVSVKIKCPFGVKFTAITESKHRHFVRFLSKNLFLSKTASAVRLITTATTSPLVAFLLINYCKVYFFYFKTFKGVDNNYTKLIQTFMSVSSESGGSRQLQQHLTFPSCLILPRESCV